jgi:hypothetical protein
MHLGRPFRNVTGILAGTPVHISPADIERIWSHFDAEAGAGASAVAGSGSGSRRRDAPAADAGERRRGTADRRRSS